MQTKLSPAELKAAILRSAIYTYEPTGKKCVTVAHVKLVFRGNVPQAQPKFVARMREIGLKLEWSDSFREYVVTDAEA